MAVDRWRAVALTVAAVASASAQPAEVAVVPAMPVHEGEGIEWTGCAVSVRGKVILQPTSGKIGAGRLLGILGPSGAGKSTLMHLLGGALRASSGVQAVGRVRFMPSGLPVDLSGGDVAFLPQAAAHFSGLTVSETLELAAKLHGRARARDDARAALGALGLAHAGETPVGERAAGGLRSGSGISGGECRRLSIGCAALLSVPRLLLADEPTSGLDAAAALRVVLQLRSIARARQLPAALTLHQPRAAIFHALDDVLLLAQGGRVVYHGSREGAERHFNRLGYERPDDAGVAEWLVDLVAIDAEDAGAARRDGERVAMLAGAWDKRAALERGRRQGDAASRLAAAPPQPVRAPFARAPSASSGLGHAAHALFAGRGRRAGGDAAREENASPDSVAARARAVSRAPRPGFGRRLWLLTLRAAKQRARAWSLLLTRAAAAWLLAHVLALVYPPALVPAATAARGAGAGLRLSLIHI